MTSSRLASSDLDDNPNCNGVSCVCCCISSTAAVFGCFSASGVVLAGVAIKTAVSAKVCNVVAAVAGAVSNLATAYDDSQTEQKEEAPYNHCEGGFKATIPLAAATLATVTDSAATGGVISAAFNGVNVGWQGFKHFMIVNINAQPIELKKSIKSKQELAVVLGPPPVKLTPGKR